MRELTDVEYDIINALYFVEPYDKILEDVGGAETIVRDALRFLIDKKLVTPMTWDEARQDYIRSFIYDADDMMAYRYLATREGLNAHHGRG